MNKKLLLLLLLFLSTLSNAQTRPKLSTDTEEYWYYIQFCNGGNVIQDMGNNANLLTKAKTEGLTSQLWKFTGTKNNYVIVSKGGRKMNYASERFQAGSTSSLKFTLISTSNTNYAPAWELQPKGQSYCVNQWGGAGVDKPLGQWNAGDNNNPLIFIPEDPITDLIPEISNGNGETWYYIQFEKGGAVLQDMGTGERLKTKIPRKQDSQLWKVTRTSTGYMLTSKQGNAITYSEGYFQANSTNSVSFEILQSASTNYALALELQRVGSENCMNQWERAGLERKLGEWKYGDDNNSLLFVSPENMDELQEGVTGKLSDYVGGTEIKNLHLPACTTIGDSAFIACSALEQLSFPYSNPPVYGKNAFSTPENTYIELDNQDNTLVLKWRNINEWNAFKWKSFSGIDEVDTPDWEISISGNNLIILGLIPDREVGLLSLTGSRQYFMPLSDGTLNVVLSPGFYIINQYNKSEKIIITK